MNRLQDAISPETLFKLKQIIEMESTGLIDSEQAGELAENLAREVYEQQQKTKRLADSLRPYLSQMGKQGSVGVKSSATTAQTDHALVRQGWREIEQVERALKDAGGNRIDFKGFSVTPPKNYRQKSGLVDQWQRLEARQRALLQDPRLGGI